MTGPNMIQLLCIDSQCSRKQSGHPAIPKAKARKGTVIDYQFSGGGSCLQSDGINYGKPCNLTFRIGMRRK